MLIKSVLLSNRKQNGDEGVICFTYGDSLSTKRLLQSSMFRDRAAQFHDRLGWNVHVNEDGEERDQYDLLNPLYLIAVDGNGRHEGSMRFLPTTGRTMIEEHFQYLVGDVPIKSPFIWECTRFCLSPNANRMTAAKLLAAGGKLMQEYCLEHFVGVFDSSTERAYRLVGAAPTIMSTQDTIQGRISAGLWEFGEDSYKALLRKARVSPEEMDRWFNILDTPEVELEMAS